jgi:hypothetical protein
MENDGGAISWEERNLQTPEPRQPRKSVARLSDEEFGNALADLVKAVERSRTHEP